MAAPSARQTRSMLCLIYLVLALVRCEGQIVDLTGVASPVMAGTDVSLTCTANDVNSAKILWMQNRTTNLAENDAIIAHPFIRNDTFKRSRWNVTFARNENLLISTLTILNVGVGPSLLYECKTGPEYIHSRSTSFTVENTKIYAHKNTLVDIRCDGIDAALSNGVSIDSSITWHRKVGSDEEVVATCSNTLVTPPAPTPSAAANLSTIVTTTPPITSPPSRVECSTLSTLQISDVEAADAGTYTCSYDFAGSQNYSWSTELHVKVPPGKPGTPRQDSNTVKSILISWTFSPVAANSAVSNYSIQYITQYSYNQSNGWTRQDLITPIRGIPKTQNTYNVTGLDSFTKYAFRVIAWNEVGSTEGDTNIHLQTAEALPPSIDPFAAEVHEKSITVKWSTKLLKGNIQAFILKFYDGTTKSTLLFNRTIPVTDYDDEMNKRYSYMIENLNASTWYCYTIQSINGDFYSPDVACIGVKTDVGAPGSPELNDLTYKDLTNTTATVKILFTPPMCVLMSPDCLDKYKIRYSQDNATNYAEKVFETGDTTIGEGARRLYDLAGLKLGSTYEIQLAGVVESRIDASKNFTGQYSNSLSIALPQGSTPIPSPQLPTTTVSTVSGGTSTTVTVGSTSSEAVTETPTSGRSQMIIIIVSVCGVLIITFIIIIVIVYKKRKSRGDMSIEMEDDLWIDVNTPLLGSSSMGYVENAYENVGIDSWAEHCKEMHANTDIQFTEEYESICQSTNPETTWRDSLEPANLSKNRYNNIVAYDRTRVALKTQPGVVHSDYINANFIDSYDKTRAFIATQGPLTNTIDDFWRMVWENNCSIIVMITNVYEKHKKKCEQYWPDSGETKYGRLTVAFMEVEELAYWTIRRFIIKNNKVSKKKHQIQRMIIQYHYTEWPDHGIPEYTFPVLAFVKRACASNPVDKGPIVVHCSAGVGRTGTFITLEAMMKQIMQKRTVNVQGFLRHIRGQRNHMVQTEDQYIFIHDALLNFIESGGRTDIQPKKFGMMIEELDTNFDNSGETILEKQYKTIIKNSPPAWLTSCALLDINSNKNRSLSFIPLDNSSRVKLPKIAGENGSDYINATYLHGHFQSREFIITQHPAAHTEYDFWRMVWDQNSMTIVILSNIGEEDCVTFYRPKGEATDWSHKSSFKLTFTDENLDMLDHAVRDFQLESKQDDYEMLTRMFSITCWPEAYTEPESYSEGVFQFIEVVNKWHAEKRNQTGPIIVIDKYGGKVASQFCALYTLYNQYHNDDTVDIYSLAYLYHMKRPGIWETQEDYRLLYNSMLQLCEPQLEEEKANDKNANAKGDLPANYAIVRRINTLPRSPEHITRTDTL